LTLGLVATQRHAHRMLAQVIADNTELDGGDLPANVFRLP
jgi:hypothetical protein